MVRQDAGTMVQGAVPRPPNHHPRRGSPHRSATPWDLHAVALGPTLRRLVASRSSRSTPWRGFAPGSCGGAGPVGDGRLYRRKPHKQASLFRRGRGPLHRRTDAIGMGLDLDLDMSPSPRSASSTGRRGGGLPVPEMRQDCRYAPRQGHQRRGTFSARLPGHGQVNPGEPLAFTDGQSMRFEAQFRSPHHCSWRGAIPRFR